MKKRCTNSRTMAVTPETLEFSDSDKFSRSVSQDSPIQKINSITSESMSEVYSPSTKDLPIPEINSTTTMKYSPDRLSRSG
jgi:hypothetical protein